MLGIVVALFASIAVGVGASSIAVADPSTGFLDDVPSTTPSNLGDIDLTELQYGDPTEGLDLVQPPKADAGGGASLAHPLDVPPGRAGVAPDLALTYDSGAGTSWVGTGWDLSVGAVTLDTEFGAPRYLAALESETYLLDGDRLFPNAIRTDLGPRVADRSDWVRQTENDHDLIIRHGSTPSTYCWQVADTKGNHRWYGGAPDEDGNCVRDDSAILTAPATGADGGVAGDFHWALTFVEDVSGNTVEFSYDELTGVAIGQGGAAIGVSLYLREITYTGFRWDTADDEPAYRVTFLRDGDVTGETQRNDMTVDAGGGVPVVTRDLLRGVQVEYLPAEFYDAVPAPPVLVKGWTLEYDAEGPFDKSLLTRVGQYGTGGPGTEHAWHEFTWFDEVTDGNGVYNGFGLMQQWGSGSEAGRVNIAAESALGTSWRAGADGGAYIGFNPIVPSKVGSFGGSFNIAGGQSNDVSTLIDLNGDGLPDKVYVDGNTVMFRRNLNKPGSTEADRYTDGSWFGAPEAVKLIEEGDSAAGDLDTLGRSSDLKIDLHFEAYPVVAIQVGGGFSFSFGDRYFEDVNGDGRVDFIRPGDAGAHTVYYNVLIAGVPTFIDSSLADWLSTRLEVPLDAFDSVNADSQVDEVADLLVNTSPRIDTVRRWLAPHDGKIRVTGDVSLTEGAAYAGDGAQVSIEYGGDVKFSEELDLANPSASPNQVFDVAAGQPVWFRVHVIENAAGDEVTWDPTIAYLNADETPRTAALDANGRSQVQFTASQDFTLFGRTGARTALTEPGELTVEVDVTTLAPLSDDLDVIVHHGRGDADPASTTVLTVPQLSVAGTSSGEMTFTVTAPATDVRDANDPDDDVEVTDWVEVEVRSDSPVDPTKFSIDISTSAPGVTPPADLSQLPPDADVDIPLEIPIVPNVRVFARSDHVAPYVPVTSPNMQTPKQSTVHVELDGAGLNFGDPDVQSAAVLTLKTLAGAVVGRTEFTVAHDVPGFFARLVGEADLTFTPASNTAYYVEVSVAVPVVGAAVDLVESTITFNWSQTEQDSEGDDITVDKSSSATNAGQLHWPDVDGMFPSANRGWALAGYNADHAGASGGGALNAAQFQFEAESGDFDEDTPVPTAADAPSAADVKGDVGGSFDPAYPYIPWGEAGSDVASMWRAAAKESLNGTATSMQSDRLGADVSIPGLPTVGRKAPQMLSIDGDFNFMLGLIASFSAAAGGGRALKDYDDYNGDGYPDIRSASSIEYTGPRGGLAVTNDAGDNTFDLSLALGGGLGGSAVSISSSGDSVENSDGGGGGSNVEPTSTKSSRGMNLGLGFSIQSQWSNPISTAGSFGSEIATNRDGAPNVLGDATANGTQVDRAYIDMNGDGLPDRVDTFTSGELWVYFNLGYRFAGDAVKWSTGRTAANKDVGGSLSVGFQLNAYEFAGGIAYNEGVGYSLFDWTDIDGDGVPDRMNNTDDSKDEPQTIFGSADGMVRDEIAYGTFPDGTVELDAHLDGNGIPLPSGQMEVSRSTGLSGGVDFSIYIGPICVVACYIVINPGVHAGYDRQTTQIQMTDMNGDGWLDAVKSTDYQDIEVRLNLRGRTNMLESVTNPLGGQVRLDYERLGNTITNPESVWVMSSVEFDDGRSGDGPDVQRSEFTYTGDTWDPLLREQLGFSKVVEEQLDENDVVVRSYERTYLNANPAETGTLVTEEMFDSTHRLVQRSTFEWQFVNANPHGAVAGGPNVGYGDPVTNLPTVGTPDRLLLFDTALSPRMMSSTMTQFDAQNAEQVLTTHFTYNVIGDVLTVHDLNEDEIEGDDTYTVITYPECAARDGDRVLGDDDTWISTPQTVTVYGGKPTPVVNPDPAIMKFRDGGPDICVNSVPVRIAELVAVDDVCGELYAITELTFDTWGSFNSVAWPSNEAPASCSDYPAANEPASFDGCASLSPEDDARRYCVDYVFDEHRHTDIAEVTDNHGVTSEATYEPRNGRLATRTDENDNLTTYTYDAAGRLATVVAPREQGGATPTISYAYGGLDATLDPNGAHTWATANVFDAFNPGNLINTATFVDGMGRVVQRKRDAEVDGVAGAARIVEGAVEFDALGRAVKEWYPIVEQVPATQLAVYNTATSQSGPAVTHVPVTAPTVRTYDVFDRMLTQTLPDGSVEQVAYDFLELPDYAGNITMSHVTASDSLGKTFTRWMDVGGAVFRVEEGAAGANNPAGDPLAAFPGAPGIKDERIEDSVSTGDIITTRYDYDRLGRLVAVVDAAGAPTAHTYDFQDNVTSTDTPDGGVVERTFAPSGQMLTVARAVGTIATYAYDRDRPVGVSYSDDTPEVTYEYGDDGAAENGAGRVVRVVDGAMERTYGYDVDGNVARETATEDPDPFGIVKDDLRTWTTTWEYDSLGRVGLLTYPDGEDLHHEYDLGGRPSRLVSDAPQDTLYDQYGVAVSRPDVEIVYVDEVRYDQFGEATFLRTGTGVETHYTFEPTRRFLATIASDATAALQFDGTTSAARPLQRLEYSYDAVGNVRDVLNRLYDAPADTKVTQLGPPPVNNVPGPSQHSYTYDGHYRLIGGVATYVDQKELRKYTYESDYDDNGTLVSKKQVTTTTSTTSNSPKPGGGGGGGKKGDGSGTGGTTTEPTCESNTGSGGGSFNQDPETTYVIAPGDLVYEEDAAGNGLHQLIRSGNRTYEWDDNGNMTGWVQPCAGGTSTISRTMEWDAENRVTRIAEGNNDTEYRYSAEGHRTLERGPGGTTWFVNEHWRTVNDGHRFATIFLGGQMVASHRTSTAAPAPPPCTDTELTTCQCSTATACRVVDVTQCNLATRVFDAATSTCQPKEARTIHFLHTDLQGSLRVATDAVGRVFQYVDYLPNGRPWVAGQSNIHDTPYLFAGGWTDTTYDLVNFGERWYDAREENFMSTEPLLEDNPYAAVDDPSVLSAYTYASSNPLRYVDPDGRASKTAYNGYDLGPKYEKHQSGTFAISVAKREQRDAPAITFGGRYSNDADGQQVQAAFQKYKDAADRYTTILSINTEDGVRKIRVFGKTVDKKDVGDKVAPDPSAVDSGADSDDAATAPPRPVSAPPQPDASDAGDQANAPPGQGGAPNDAGPGDAGAGASPPEADDAKSGGDDAPSPQPSSASPPNAGAPDAAGPDDG